MIRNSLVNKEYMLYFDWATLEALPSLFLGSGPLKRGGGSWSSSRYFVSFKKGFTIKTFHNLCNSLMEMSGFKYYEYKVKPFLYFHPVRNPWNLTLHWINLWYAQLKTWTPVVSSNHKVNSLTCLARILHAIMLNETEKKCCMWFCSHFISYMYLFVSRIYISGFQWCSAFRSS